VLGAKLHNTCRTDVRRGVSNPNNLICDRVSNLCMPRHRSESEAANRAPTTVAPLTVAIREDLWQGFTAFTVSKSNHYDNNGSITIL
jgi:hypothetical protein